MRYLLDTNSVIDLLNSLEGRLAKRVRSHQPGDLCISTISLHELYFGAFKSRLVERNVAVLDVLQFETLSFSKDDARQAGEIRAALAAEGTPIDPYDVLIAGQAKARRLILITRNSGEFGRLVGLRIEDWQSSR